MKKNNVIKLSISILVIIFIICGLNIRSKFMVFNSSSMEPSIKKSEAVRIDRKAFYHDKIKRFDIVLFNPSYKTPSGNSERALRVVGLPNEKVTISGGKLYIDEELVPLPEELKNIDFVSMKTGISSWEVPTEEYFLLGDNPNVAVDSRLTGTVHKNQIIGRVTLYD